MPNLPDMRLQGPPLDGDMEVWDGTHGQWILTSQLDYALSPLVSGMTSLDQLVAATNLVYVSTRSSASDSNDGLSWWTAKATIAGALATLGGSAGTVVLDGRTWTLTSTDSFGNGVTLPNTGTILRGAGKYLTSINIGVNCTWGVKAFAGHCQVQDLTVNILNGVTASYGVGVSTTSPGSAEGCQFKDIQVGVLGTVTACYAAGPDHPGASDLDISVTHFEECYTTVTGGGSGTYGFLFGNGTTGNTLIPIAINCNANFTSYAVGLAGCGVTWIAGGSSGTLVADIIIIHTGLDSITFVGYRGENGVMALTAGYVGSLASAMILDNCDFLSYTGPGASGNIIVWDVTGCLIVRGGQHNTTGANTNYIFNNSSGNQNSVIFQGVTTDVANPFPALNLARTIRTIINHQYISSGLTTPSPGLSHLVDGGIQFDGPTMWGGTGVPASGLGGNGDFYLRQDGGMSTHVYFKSSGSWAGII